MATAPFQLDMNYVTNLLAKQGIGTASKVSQATGKFIPIAADSKGVYNNPYAGKNYGFDQKAFGAGGGGDARYDFTQQGSGLWSIGINPGDPQAINKAIDWYKSQDAGTRAEIGKLSGSKVNDPVGFLDAIDARQRDVARNIQKENGFLDSTFGQILTTLGTVALGAVPGVGPALAAGAGAITGGIKGGIGGALLGGLGGYGAGQLGSSLATNGISGTIKNFTSGFSNMFGGGAAPISTPSLNPANVVQGVGGAVNAAANAVPGLSSGVNAASLAASLGPSAGSAAGLLPAGAGGISTAAGAGTGATLAQILGQAGASAGSAGSAATGTTATGTGVTNAAPISTPSATASNVVPGVGGSVAGGASTGASAIQKILGVLGGSGAAGTAGAGGLGAASLNLLQGVLGQMNQSDLEKIVGQLNTTNQTLVNSMPPISYRDSILNNLDMIMNRPGQLMEQGPYKDYMDYAQRSIERKMVAQGYGGVGQSTNTADAVTRATLESMAGIVQRDREIATNQIAPWFNVAVGGATNMANSVEARMLPGAQQAGNIQNIITGGAGILQDLFS